MFWRAYSIKISDADQTRGKKRGEYIICLKTSYVLSLNFGKYNFQTLMS